MAAAADTGQQPPTLRYLQGYPPALLEQVQALLAQGQLHATLQRRHPERHQVRNDRALVAYVGELKARHMKNAPPLAQVAFDNHLHVVHHALGTHTAVSRVQGGRLKAKRELRVASLFKDAPANLLRMIVVHELAHLRERAHDKAFYALCTHMEPDYHQWEFDTRLWLTALELEGPARAA
ncbi:MAG: YgjP-like metallopeptidase domain-containing protein [Rubrivivax sp.]